MKRAFTLAAMAALVFTACEKNESVQTDANNAVQFVVDQVVTKLTTSGNTTQFTGDEEIKITSSGLVNDITNEIYTNTNNGLSGETVYFGKEQASFVAHYPVTANNNEGSIIMSVGMDQDSEEDFHNNMFMVATATGNRNSRTVNLSFAHQLAMVKVNVIGIDDATSVTIHNVKPEVTWSTSGTVTSDEAGFININAWKQELTQEYWALIPAQVVGQGTKLISITDSKDKTYEYVLDEAITFYTGKAKTINLTLQDNSVTAVFSDINNVNWENDEDFDGNFNEVPVEGITLDKSTADLSINETLTLIATVTPENATDKSVVWSSSNEEIATVNNGVVTAMAAGTAAITATAGEFKATCTVTVSEQVANIPVESVTLNQTTATVKVGQTLTLTATVNPDNATDQNVTWSSSEDNVATVAGGVVTAKTVGTAEITATAGNQSATCTVTVVAPLELISAETGDFRDEVFADTKMTNYSGLTENKWNIGSNANVNVENNEAIIKVNNTTNKRYNRGIGFRTVAIPDDVTALTLSFNAYCSVASQNLCIAAMKPQESNTPFKVNGSNTQTPTLETTSKEYTYTIDLTSADRTTGDDGIVIMLAPGNATDNVSIEPTWYVSNVRLIEIVSK